MSGRRLGPRVPPPPRDEGAAAVAAVVGGAGTLHGHAATVHEGQLRPPLAPARADPLDERHVAELAVSIRAIGLKSELLVSPGGRLADGRDSYHVDDGQHRLAALRRVIAEEADPGRQQTLSLIRVQVGTSDPAARAAMQLDVHGLRRALADLDRARLYRRIRKEQGFTSNVQVAAYLRAAQPDTYADLAHHQIDHLLELVADPGVEAALAAGHIREAVAHRLARLTDAIARAAFLRRAAAGEALTTAEIQAALALAAPRRRRHAASPAQRGTPPEAAPSVPRDPLLASPVGSDPLYDSVVRPAGALAAAEDDDVAGAATIVTDQAYDTVVSEEDAEEGPPDAPPVLLGSGELRAIRRRLERGSRPHDSAARAELHAIAVAVRALLA